MDCLHQCGTKKILRKTIWATINRSKGQSASEGDAVGLEGHRVLRTPSTQPNDKFRQILFSIRPTKGSNRKASGIGKSERCRLPSGQHQTSSHCNLAGMSYPSYSLDLAPSDYHLFRSLQNSLNGKNFNSLEACKNHLKQFIVQKDVKFWMNGIVKLPQKWQKVVEQNRTYVWINPYTNI